MLDFSSVISILLPDSQNDVVLMEDANGNVLWQSGGGNPYESKYFFVENKSFVRNTVYITPQGSGTPQVTFYVSPDEDYWMELGTTNYYSAPLQFTLDVNERKYIKAYADTFYGSSGNDYITISCDGEYDVGGNIMSLLYGDGFLQAEPSFTPGYTHQFRGLFNGSTTLENANHLVLPVTVLKPYCYQIMFAGCTSLTTAPTLPATTMSEGCYKQMFQGCTSLTTAPTLPSLSLDSNCYYGMFLNCTSLVTAPALPATTLASYCYNFMFSGCTSLTTAPTLPATTLANYCYQCMFQNCTSLTTVPQTLPATTLAYGCYQYMFSGCTSLTTAPALPATTLATGCYESMFQGCTVLTTAPALSAMTLEQFCYASMFYDCTSLTTAPSLSATTLAEGCYSGMFGGCTSLTTAPTLPAPLLAQECYSFMFYGCSSLDYIKAMFVTTPGTSYTRDWVNGVAASGTFVKNELATWTVSGDNGIPTSWSVETDTNTDDRASYFYFEDTSGTSNQISLKKANSSAPTITLSYSTDLSSWLTLSGSSTTAKTITLPANGKVYLKCTADRWCSTSNSGYYNNLTTTKNAIVGGNIMSLIYGDAFPDNISTKNTYSLSGVLRDNTHLISAERLALPATSLTSNCYYMMFRGCTALTTAPALPAMTLATDCYGSMFRGCTALTTAPALPATTLTSTCYGYMFYSCSALTTAPVLPATTLVQNCYKYMFNGCSRLNYIKAMFTTTPSTTYTDYWVNGVAASGTFVKNSSATWNVTGNYGVPSGWTVQTASS